ncbi:MAG TPA: serine hydrolase domain-containing protein [Candidatus Binatia bacterium]|jgi:CubicO group peptidase (beta-lactamase class C family)|nr:serine hydrolase domain-containing protein [Candidatus Binatia bacterium]
MKRYASVTFLFLLLVHLSGAPILSAQTDPIDRYIQAEMKSRMIPGLALVVIKNGEVVKIKGYGFANLEHDVPATPDTVFELASVTKQFTATAIMALVEEGKIKLDDPINRYLPSSPENWKAITVRHLLTHTAGLAGMWAGFEALHQDGGRTDLTTAQMFEAATKDPMSFTPGDRWQYSNVGYFLLGMIIEKASGRSYRDFLTDRFFGPLAMTSTSVPDQWTILKNRAAGYTLRDGELINIRRVTQVELPSDYGIFSTVKDLVKWDNALATGKVVKPSSLEQTWTPVKLNGGSSFPYGFGWFFDESRGHRIITHTGVTGTEYTRFPDDQLEKRLQELRSFTFLACDEIKGRVLERFGAAVSRACYYKMVAGSETRYYTFALTSDDKVADFWSSTE